MTRARTTRTFVTKESLSKAKPPCFVATGIFDNPLIIRKPGTLAEVCAANEVLIKVQDLAEISAESGEASFDKFERPIAEVARKHMLDEEGKPLFDTVDELMECPATSFDTYLSVITLLMAEKETTDVATELAGRAEKLAQGAQ